MVDRETLDRRLAKLESCLRELRKLAPTQRAHFLRDVALQAQAERWLHLAAESALDIAHHLIADRGWRTPATYREAFAILVDEGVIDPQLGGPRNPVFEPGSKQAGTRTACLVRAVIGFDPWAPRWPQAPIQRHLPTDRPTHRKGRFLLAPRLVARCTDSADHRHHPALDA